MIEAAILDTGPLVAFMHSQEQHHACLVRMSELYPDMPVFTLDKDFQVYRRNGRERIEAILPA